MNSAADASDSVLAERAAAGDDSAYAELVRRHKEGLYRLLRRYTGDPEDAYEAAHEAFIAAWRALPRYDPNRPFAAWLRTIAINKARDRSRRARVRRLFLVSNTLDEAEPAGVADPVAGQDEALAAQQQMRSLERAIAGLPAQLKEPLLLTVFEGLSQQQAGEILGVSVKAVETRVYRARKILEQRLAKATQQA